MVLEAKQEKWFKKAMAGFERVWVPAVKAAESFDAFCKGISAITGLPESVVRSSIPATNWAEFQKEAEKYLPIAKSKIEAAFKAGKWARRYRRAFGGS
jgi:hypothetical protein